MGEGTLESLIIVWMTRDSDAELRLGVGIDLGLGVGMDLGLEVGMDLGLEHWVGNGN